MSIYQLDHAPALSRSGSDGSFGFDRAPEGRVPFTVAAPDCLFRSSALSLTSPATDVSLTIICEAPSVSRQYYGELVRDVLQSSMPRTLQSWSSPPHFYIRAITQDTGLPVSEAVVSAVARLIRNSIPELTGGSLAAGSVEVGTDERSFRDGWVHVEFFTLLPSGFSGEATVGPGDGRYIRLRYGPVFDEEASRFPTGRSCGSVTVEIADHEIVHTMGFYHTRDWYPDFQSDVTCSGQNRPASVRQHAAIMYTRPPGNSYEDADPDAYLMPLRARAEPVVALCRLPPQFQRVDVGRR